ncbi:hypothetical protein BV22DRAFT_1037970 [Leucogyrophana mollusca]|uniref:Uncharacterized protein n=1 Tax=Leucogyrophana mollusca TaxID=85980 RepID=A0ACB8B8F4_9AGAM|nr:hypothetical protein BV22DRAFT_1037970 [Leucogyrophana mollusca]
MSGSLFLTFPLSVHLCLLRIPLMQVSKRCLRRAPWPSYLSNSTTFYATFLYVKEEELPVRLLGSSGPGPATTSRPLGCLPFLLPSF